MDRLERTADRVAQALALVGAVGVLALLVHVCIDVLTRNLMGRPIPATNEIVSHYYMVLIAFLPMAWVERERAMVSVELLDSVLSPRARLVSDALVALLATVVYLLIAWTNGQAALSRWAVGSFVDVLGYRVPVWPSYFLAPAGFLLAALVTALRAAQVGRKAVAP